MRLAIVVLQIVLFAGFMWSATKYFKKQPGKKDTRQQAIQLLGLIQILNAFYCDFSSFPSSAYQQYFALFFYLISIIYFYWTYSTVKKMLLNFAFSKSQPQYIIQNGPYKRLRHPFYFSYICAWIATFFATNYSIIAGVAGIALTTLYIKAALQEENEFSLALADSYRSYKSSTSRIIPFIY